MEVTTISKQEARKIILASQGLKHPSRAGQSAKRLALESIQQIGYVQIDTISVVQRAHHHVIQSRVPHYQPTVLNKLEAERSIFEYWSHAASYLPMENYRFTLPIKAEILQKERFWFKKDPQLMQQILDRMAAEGPLRSRDFERPAQQKTAMWDSHPAKQALQNLFMEGRIMVSGREGFQKVYDLTERVVPATVDISMPDQSEYIRYLIERDIRAHGMVAVEDIGYLLKGLKNSIKEELDQMVGTGQFIPIRIERDKLTYYTHTAALELLNHRFTHRLKFLNPFDNLIINRTRTKRLLDFDYIIEIYIPAEKRKFGYYGLPILWKDKLVGQVDMKANRKTGQMLIKNLEVNTRRTDQFIGAWSEALQEFMCFNEMHEVVFEDKPHKAFPDLASVP